MARTRGERHQSRKRAQVRESSDAQHPFDVVSGALGGFSVSQSRPAAMPWGRAPHGAPEAQNGMNDATPSGFSGSPQGGNDATVSLPASALLPGIFAWTPRPGDAPMDRTDDGAQEPGVGPVAGPTGVTVDGTGHETPNQDVAGQHDWHEPSTDPAPWPGERVRRRPTGYTSYREPLRNFPSEIVIDVEPIEIGAEAGADSAVKPAVVSPLRDERPTVHTRRGHFLGGAIAAAVATIALLAGVAAILSERREPPASSPARPAPGAHAVPRMQAGPTPAPAVVQRATRQVETTSAPTARGFRQEEPLEAARARDGGDGHEVNRRRVEPPQVRQDDGPTATFHEDLTVGPTFEPEVAKLRGGIAYHESVRSILAPYRGEKVFVDVIVGPDGRVEVLGVSAGFPLSGFVRERFKEAVGRSSWVPARDGWGQAVASRVRVAIVVN